jgi:hypothetical protein
MINNAEHFTRGSGCNMGKVSWLWNAEKIHQV